LSDIRSNGLTLPPQAVHRHGCDVGSGRNIHLAEISRHVTEGAHAALVLDQASWHTSPKLRVPENVSLLPLPPYASELNPQSSRMRSPR